MSINHTIRTKEGGTETVKLRPMSAIVANCKECMGWESKPVDCTSTLCPLYPFRTGDAHSGKTMSEANRAAASERLRKAKNAITE